MLVVNGTLITWEMPNRILYHYAMLIREGKISEIGPQEDLLQRYPNEERFDAKNRYVMPGNLCAHTHFYGAFSRGMAIPGAAPADFPEKLSKLWWPLDRSLSLEDVRYSALVCLVEAVRHGTTGECPGHWLAHRSGLVLAGTVGSGCEILADQDG